MKTLRLPSYLIVAAARCFLIGLTWTTTTAIAADLNVTGNLTVTGTIDSDANSQTFGTQSSGTPTTPAIIESYSNDSVPAFGSDTGAFDSFKFLVNRYPASWLWLNNAASTGTVNAMRLDNAHQLILFGADGTTAGLTFTPQTYKITLGPNTNATLIGNATTGVITSGGGLTVTGPLTVSGGITTNTGSFGGETRFDSMPYTPPMSPTATSGTTTFGWGGVYVGTLTGNLTISSFSGTEAPGKKVRLVLVCSGSQSITFPASYRAGQANATVTTLTPAAGRHVLFFESLDGAGLRLLTDTYAGQLDAGSVTVAATPAHYSPSSSSVEAHLAGIDTALASTGGASVSDETYNSTTWNGVTTVAPSKNAVRNQLEAISAGSVVPTKTANFWPTSDLANKPAGWLLAGDGGTPAAAAVGGYSMIVKGNGVVGNPTFAPAAGSYTSTQSVTISSVTSGSTIRYTTDGSAPSRSAGIVYSTPVSIPTTTTLKAIAYKDYSDDSSVNSSAYTIAIPSPAFVSEDSRGGFVGSSSSFTITLTGGMAVGKRVVLFYSSDGSSALSSVTDSSGNTYSLIKSQAAYNDSTIFTAIYSAHVTTALAPGATITVNIGSTGYSNKAWMVCSLSGCASSGQPDQSTGNSTYTSTVSASASPVSSPTLLMGSVSCRTAETYSGGSWTTIGSAQDYGIQRTYFVYKTVTGTSAQSPGGSLSATEITTVQWASFK